MAFRTKLDFSSNRQVKQNIETFTVLSGGTSFGVTFNDLPSGPNLTTTAETGTLTFIASTFSGNSATTIYSWYTDIMELGTSTLSAITPTNSGTTQIVSNAFSATSFTTIDGNTIALAYTGVSYDLYVIAMSDLGGGNYSGTVETEELIFLSADTLDFTGRTIWNDVSGITRTERLIVTDSPQIGYVLGCIDSEGMSAWVPATSGGTANFTGGTVNGSTNFTNGLSANTISATTYFNLPTIGTSPISVVNTSNLFSTGLNLTGFNASGVTNSIFLGVQSGYNATSANNSNFMGYNAGYGATNASDSNFMGYNAGYGVTNANDSNLFGQYAGYGAINANYSNFMGSGAGYQAIDSHHANFIGLNAGNGATNAQYSNFFGYQAGVDAKEADYSNFIGFDAGYDASGSNISNFIGYMAGMNATNASGSTFIGASAGYNATGATYSNFIGYSAGLNAIDANHSIFIGYNVGSNVSVATSIGSNNIIIGTNISLSAGTTDTINIGGVLFGTGTYSATTGTPSLSGQTQGKIGINIVTPTETLDVSENARFRSIGASTSAGALYYTSNGVLTTNTSDTRLKYNVNTLTNALEKVKQLRGVSYDWIDGDGPTRIGFIAQEVEQIVPELTFVNKNSPENYMGVHYENTVALLVEAIKELSAGVTTSNNTHLETQTILAEDNNIDLNYNGTLETAIGGGITVLHAMGTDLSAKIITDENGNWITNNDFKPKDLTIPIYTPLSSADINGNIGNLTRDEDYLYLKTNSGWKRTNLESF